jgi:putative peptidoglycan lipid II flippase
VTVLQGEIQVEGREGSMSRHSALVASGMLFSRLAGLIRDRVFAYYFGSSDAADVFRAAFRIPNLLQNLFGEGVLSAAFIPIYVKLLSKEGGEEADKLASAIFCLLTLVMSCLVLVGIFATPLLISLIAPGFTGQKLALAISLVRVLFPGAALLAISAWCLGILNSHRKFFISYTAPVAWNFVMIVTLIAFGSHLGQFSLAKVLAWGSVLGSAVQLGVQLPHVARLMGRFRVSLGLALKTVQTVIRNFVPVLISRGVVQISAYVDTLIASFLPTGALAGLVYAQTLYTLPVSLFGMSVSAAELPALSRKSGDDDETIVYRRARLNTGLRQIAFFIIPSAMAFFALGDVIAGAIYQTGRFTHRDAVYVWAILAGSAVGLLANTLGRLYAAMYYALHDTRTPLYYAIARVALTAALGYLAALRLPSPLGVDPRWGVAGLALSSGLSGWLEFALLKHSLKKRIGKTGLPASFAIKLWLSAGAGAIVGWAAKLAMSGSHPLLLGAVVLGLYGLVYFAIAHALRVPEVRGLFGRVTKIAGIRW